MLLTSKEFLVDGSVLKSADLVWERGEDSQYQIKFYEQATWRATRRTCFYKCFNYHNSSLEECCDVHFFSNLLFLPLFREPSGWRFTSSHLSNGELERLTGHDTLSGVRGLGDERSTSTWMSSVSSGLLLRGLLLALPLLGTVGLRRALLLPFLLLKPLELSPGSLRSTRSKAVDRTESHFECFFMFGWKINMAFLGFPSEYWLWWCFSHTEEWLACGC